MAEGSGFGRLAVVIPSVTFVIGLALGWALVSVSQTGGDAEGAAEPSPEVSSSPSPSSVDGSIVVTVPLACQESARNLREATRLLRASVTSVRDFDPDELVDTLNRLETLDRETRPLLDECSQASVTESPGPTVDDTLTPTDSE